MRDVVYRFSIVVVFLLTWGTLSGLVLAQEPPVLEISLVPQTEYAVAGQPFTYTVMVTNAGQIPAKDIIVLVETPVGTNLINTNQSDTWPVGVHHADNTDTIVWNALAPIPPADVVIFVVILEILPEMVAQQLVSNNIAILNGTSGEVIAAGLPVIVQVLAPPPTATPSPQPNATATTAATATPIFTSTPPPLPPAPTVEPTLLNTPTPPLTPNQENESSIPVMPILLGLIVLATGTISLIWFLKRR